MTNIKEAAEKHEPKKTKVVSDLEVVRMDSEIKEETAQDEKGVDFTYSYITVNGVKYRVPDSVLNSLKIIIAASPNITSFKVTKTGTGMSTRYTVIPLG